MASESINLKALFAELIEIHAPLNPAIQFEVEDVDRPVYLNANRDSLSRAIENLLTNAGHFAQKLVRIRAEQRDHEIEIQVDDDGPGIPPSDREKVLEPFMRLENSNQPGSGLGLALVHRIARRMAGEIVIGDSPNGGARLSLVIPNS
jgi:two-component system sensor histidine kinase RstB